MTNLVVTLGLGLALAISRLAPAGAQKPDLAQLQAKLAGVASALSNKEYAKAVDLAKKLQREAGRDNPMAAALDPLIEQAQCGVRAQKNGTDGSECGIDAAALGLDGKSVTEGGGTGRARGASSSSPGSELGKSDSSKWGIDSLNQR